MPESLVFDDISIEVRRKRMKRLRLTISAATGEVRLSVPLGEPWEHVRSFAHSHLEWIRKNRCRIEGQEEPSDFRDAAIHFVWGKACQLQLDRREEAPAVWLEGSVLHLRVRPVARPEQMEALLEDWYRRLLREAALPLLRTWENRLRLPTVTLSVRRMKSRWGSCTPGRCTIRLNSELAKRPPECLEYIVVHELAHLLEPNHGARFQAILDRHLPDWRVTKQRLNRFPLEEVPHEADLS